MSVAAGKPSDATATLVAIGLVIVVVTAAACVGIVNGSWRPLLFAGVCSVGVALLGLVVDGIRNARRSSS